MPLPLSPPFEVVAEREGSLLPVPLLPLPLPCPTPPLTTCLPLAPARPITPLASPLLSLPPAPAPDSFLTCTLGVGSESKSVVAITKSATRSSASVSIRMGEPPVVKAVERVDWRKSERVMMACSECGRVSSFLLSLPSSLLLPHSFLSRSFSHSSPPTKPSHSP